MQVIVRFSAFVTNNWDRNRTVVTIEIFRFRWTWDTHQSLQEQLHEKHRIFDLRQFLSPVLVLHCSPSFSLYALGIYRPCSLYPANLWLRIFYASRIWAVAAGPLQIGWNDQHDSKWSQLQWTDSALVLKSHLSRDLKDGVSGPFYIVRVEFLQSTKISIFQHTENSSLHEKNKAWERTRSRTTGLHYHVQVKWLF